MRKFFTILCLGLFALTFRNCKTSVQGDQPASLVKLTDSLPDVLTGKRSDLIARNLRYKAALKFSEHQLPDDIKEWKEYRVNLKSEVIRKAGVVIDHKLPLNIREDGWK